MYQIRITVRSYELDSLGHVNHAVYHQYAEVARMSGFREAGCDWEELLTKGIGPVLLTTTATFHSELRGGAEIDVSLEVKFGTGKTFNVDSTITKADGTVAAEITCIIGLMNLKERKLFPDPRALLAELGCDLPLLTG
jgi:acyl-CoA thioester hydrolase